MADSIDKAAQGNASQGPLALADMKSLAVLEISGDRAGLLSTPDKTSGAKAGLEQEEPIKRAMMEEDKGKDGNSHEEKEEEEEEEEPPIAEILEWRATINAFQSLTAIRRWYFKPGKKEWCIGTNRPTKPTTVDARNLWMAELAMDGIEPGSYELVICISLKDMDVDTIESITTDCWPASSKGFFYSTENATATLIEKAEARRFPKDDFARLRLYRPIGHQLGRCQFFSISLIAEAGADPTPSFEIHYIEVQPIQHRSTEVNRDHLVFGDDNPSQIISVGPSDGVSNEPVEIRAYDLSDTGDYAGTLYISNSIAHVDMWDLRTKAGQYDTSSPQFFKTPFAQTTFEVPPSLTDSLNSLTISISMSAFGSQMTVSTITKVGDEEGIPFRVYRCSPTAPADKDLSRPWPLKKATTICDGEYFNLISFHRSDPESTDEEDERFWTCDGCVFTVYSTKGRWALLYSLQMQWKADALTAQTVLTSIQGRYFAWTGSRGAISIWDFDTGKLVSHIFTGDNSNAAYPSLSPDGSKVALSVKGTIQIRDTLTGIKLGIFKKGLNDGNFYEVAFGRDHFMAFNAEVSTSSRQLRHNMRSIVRARDLAIVKIHQIREDYRFQYPQTGHDPVFAYSHGPNLNIVKLGPILSPAPCIECGGDGVCESKVIASYTLHQNCYYELENSAGSKFVLSSDIQSIFGRSTKVVGVFIQNEDREKEGEEDAKKDGEEDEEGEDREIVRSMIIPVGSNVSSYTAFFLPETSQLGIVTDGTGYLQLWTLSAKGPRVCELALIWRFQELPEDMEWTDVCYREVLSVEACVHAKKVKVRLMPAKWYRYTYDITAIAGDPQEDTLTVPLSDEDSLSASEEYRLAEGFIRLVSVYAMGADDCKESIIRYLKKYIRPTLESPVSSLITLCIAWEQDKKHYFETIMKELLPIDRITWVPDANATKGDNPLGIILEKAKTRSSAYGAAKIIMDYCVTHANRSRNLAFLKPLYDVFGDVMEVFPDEAYQILGRIAFIPVMHYSYILENRIIAEPPRIRLRFWEPRNEVIYKLKNPIFQLRVSAEEPDPNNHKFTRPIFMVAFDALWHYRDETKPPGSNADALKDVSDTTTTNWYKTLYYMIRLKTRLRIHNYVEAYDFSIEFYDNPAIAALVTYKWNTIGHWYWLVRFSSQCCFYALVVIASLMQVYYHQPSQLIGLFIAIIVLAAVFLWLELLQAFRSVSRYTKSGYNILDVLAFGLPMTAAIQQLFVIYQSDSLGNTRLLSFSVLAVFLHMLFELRINKSVCKYVTIIQETVIEIRVFFIIFATGILGFAVATLHLLRGCPYEGCEEPETAFSHNFLGALSDTYFFMGGRWDPVSDEFAAQEWAFHLLMAIFFFFTVVLMLNVLIALINVAFQKGDDGWRLVWTESRLRYIELAENMSYHIPGFRKTHNWFPKEIYFTATAKQVRAYREKYHARDRATEDLEMMEKWMRGPEDDDDYQDDDEEVDADVGGGETNMDTKQEGDRDKEDSAVTEKNEDEKNKNSADDDEADRGHTRHLDGVIEDLSEAEYRNTIEDSARRRRRVKAIPSSDNLTGVRGAESDTEEQDVSFSHQGQGDLAVRMLNVQVGDLKSQVGELQMQLMAQQEQAQRQFEELKNLLTQRAGN